MNNERNNEFISNFIRSGRQDGLFDSLLLVGTNMIINDLSGNQNMSNNYRSFYYNSTGNLEYLQNTANLENSENSNFLLNHVINRSFHEKPIYKNVISEKGLLELEERKFNQSDKNHSCPIFQVNFTNESDIIKLPCNHVFTPDAIKKWLKEENAICPVCRYKLDSVEIKNETATPSTNSYEYNLQFSFVPENDNENENENENDSEESHEAQIYPEINYENYEHDENEHNENEHNEDENEDDNNYNNNNNNYDYDYDYENQNYYDYEHENDDENENENENDDIVPNPSTFFDYVMQMFNREEERLQMEQQAIQQTILNSLERNNNE